MSNIDLRTVASFGDEWGRYEQGELDVDEHRHMFQAYFDIFPWDEIEIESNAQGFDMGCGSGRWAMLVAPRVGHLNCIDPSFEALEVAKRNLRNQPNVTFHQSDVSNCVITPESQDFGYSLGVLHHIPDTQSALKDCARLLKPGAPLLIYLYYNFDNRPAWYRILWQSSEVGRAFISRCPSALKSFATEFLAATVYWPLARLAWIGEKLRLRVSNWPLSSYRHLSFYTMRTDSRDRFGTPLEQRFSKKEILMMMEATGLERVRFSEHAPFWCAVGFKRR